MIYPPSNKERRWTRGELVLVVVLTLVLLNADWLAGTVARAEWRGRARLPVAGWAYYYAPGVMAEVYANRLAWRQVQPCPERIGMVSLLRAGDIGRRVWIGRAGGREGPFLVVDCSEEDRYVLRKGRHDVVEVDWATAQRWGMRGRIRVTVYGGKT